METASDFFSNLVKNVCATCLFQGTTYRVIDDRSKSMLELLGFKLRPEYKICHACRALLEKLRLFMEHANNTQMYFKAAMKSNNLFECRTKIFGEPKSSPLEYRLPVIAEIKSKPVKTLEQVFNNSDIIKNNIKMVGDNVKHSNATVNKHTLNNVVESVIEKLPSNDQLTITRSINKIDNDKETTTHLVTHNTIVKQQESVTDKKIIDNNVCLIIDSKEKQPVVVNNKVKCVARFVSPANGEVQYIVMEPQENVESNEIKQTEEATVISQDKEPKPQKNEVNLDTPIRKRGVQELIINRVTSGGNIRNPPPNENRRLVKPANKSLRLHSSTSIKYYINKGLRQYAPSQAELDQRQIVLQKSYIQNKPNLRVPENACTISAEMPIENHDSPGILNLQIENAQSTPAEINTANIKVEKIVPDVPDEVDEFVDRREPINVKIEQEELDIKTEPIFDHSDSATVSVDLNHSDYQSYINDLDDYGHYTPPSRHESDSLDEEYILGNNENNRDINSTKLLNNKTIKQKSNMTMQDLLKVIYYENGSEESVEVKLPVKRKTSNSTIQAKKKRTESENEETSNSVPNSNGEKIVKDNLYMIPIVPLVRIDQGLLLNIKTEKEDEESETTCVDEHISLLPNIYNRKKNYVEMFLEDDEILAVREMMRNQTEFLEAEHKCLTCILAFRSPTAMISHNNAVHAKRNGNFLCEICECRYKGKKKLESHVLEHRRWYKCAICSQQYFKRQHVRKHLNREHNAMSMSLKVEQ